MENLPTKAGLSSNRRRLVETMQHLNFGRIESLVIRKGEPTFVPAPHLIQDIKIGSDAGPRPERSREDFALRASVIELFEHFNRLPDGALVAVEVRHGLPFRVIVEPLWEEWA